MQCYGASFEFEFMFPFGFGSDLSLRALVVVIILCLSCGLELQETIPSFPPEVVFNKNPLCGHERGWSLVPDYGDKGLLISS